MKQFNEQDDAMLAVKFYNKAVLQSAKSKVEGRQIFEDVEYVSIRIPGDKTTQVERPVREEDRERFRSRYESFKNRETQKVEGTPIGMLPGLTPAEIENWQARGFETLEQISGMTEQAITRSGLGARDIVNRAKKYLEGSNYTDQLKVEIDELKEQNKELTKKINEILAKSEVKNEPINNNAKRGKRNGAGGATNNGS